jgi:deoxyguanosine kinase
VTNTHNEQYEPRYIVVEGPIGAGKTTLAQLLADRLGSQIILEEFEENPFLPDFYRDRKRFAFQTQLFFLLSRFRQQQELAQADLFYTSVVSDYLFAKDRIFAAINLSESEMELYSEVEQALIRTVPVPDVVIYLQGSPEVLMEYIQQRGRPYEKILTVEYLNHVVGAYNDLFFHYRDSRLIVVDANQMDFVGKPEHIEMLLDAIFRTPHPPVEYLTAHRERLEGTMFSQ